MPNKDQVYAVADLLLSQGKSVSLRTIIATVPGGGNNRTVGPHLRDWKVDRDYRPKLQVKDLPERLQAELARFVTHAWDAAKEDAAGRLVAEQERLEAQRRANDDLRNEALSGLDALVEANARLTREADTLRAENVQLRKRLDRVRAEEFWDRVMLEVHDLLPVGGSLPMEEVLAGLKPSIHRGARLNKEPLDAKTLRKKMAVRNVHGKYFEELPNGTLVRQAG